MADKNKTEPGIEKSSGVAGGGEVQARKDEEEEKGYRGVKADPTPDERYSQLSDDWRTPENDPDTAAEAGTRGKFMDIDDLAERERSKK